MKKRIVVYILGWLLVFEGFFLMLPCFVGVIYQEVEAVWFAIVALVCLCLGFIITRLKPKDKTMYAREGFVITALSWVLLSLFGALPFVLCNVVPSYVDAVFETASGFTTTGATIFPEVQSLPYCINFWRTFTHWIGGMGVLVFMMAVVSLADGRNMYLMKAESPGPSVSKLVPHVKSTAKILYGLYIGLSVLEFIFLMFGDMDVFQAITTTFGTAGTGGFGIMNDSMGSFSNYTQIVVTIFMIAFGINFSFYYLLILKKAWKDALKLSEVRVYIGIIIVASLLIMFNIRGQMGSYPNAAKHAFFQVASIITTTGYSTVDFNRWPEFSKTIMISLMFIGACAGSTGGGMKISRFIIWAKTFFKELKVMIHPRNIYKISMDGRKVEHETVRSVNVYLVAYILLFFASLLIISIDGYDFETNFTSVATTINNVGPGFHLAGPASNFSFFSPLSKVVMIVDMIAGRLELFPLLLLFSATTWKK